MSGPVTVAVISAAATIIAAVLPVWLSLRHKIGQIHHHMVNTHPTIMRDDLDKAIRMIGANTDTTNLVSKQLGEVHRHLIAHGGDIAALRDQLHEERQQRIEEDRQLLAGLRSAQTG